MNLETSFTDNAASSSRAENISVSRPSTTLTFESECAAAGRHRQSVDSSGPVLSERMLLVGKSAEFPPGKMVEFPPMRRASSPAGPAAQHRLVLVLLLLRLMTCCSPLQFNICYKFILLFLIVIFHLKYGSFVDMLILAYTGYMLLMMLIYTVLV